jgi:hypothetical protein
VRKWIFRIGLIVSLIVLFFPENGAAQEEVFKEKAGRFVEDYNRQEFARLVELFHFPEEYTEAERKKDKEAIGKTLKIYFDAFGKIASFEKVTDPPFYYFVTIGSADIPYWKSHPEGDTATYKVKFSREGEGSLGLVFSYILKKWEIRQVNYGLPADRPQSEKRISTIFQKWQKEMTQ